jgi:hypothetical protein
MEGEELLTVDTGAIEDAGGDLDLGAVTEETSTDTDSSVDETTKIADESTEEEQPKTSKEEPELAEFHGQVSSKLRAIVKQAPELAQVFQKYPKLKDQIEATFRRETALREVFPTVAEARFMRDQFPNGQADVQALRDDVQELEALDQAFDKRGQDGTFPGHRTIISNMFERNQETAVSFMKEFPKVWAQLHRDSYDEVMGKVVGATLNARGVPDYIGRLAESLKEDQPDAYQGLMSVVAWMQKFSADKPQPSEDEQRLSRDKAEFNRERGESNKQVNQRFHSEFIASSKKLQTSTISLHPAIKRLELVKALSPEKRASIIEQIRVNTERLLSKSPSFMRKLRPLYEARNLEEIEKLQKAAWSQPWLINSQIRRVLSKEVPQMVQQNRDAAARRAGTTRQASPVNSGEKQPTTARKGARQVGGRWYKEDGKLFSTAELLAGKHLQT